MRTPLLILSSLAALGCGSGKGTVDDGPGTADSGDPIADADDVATACAEGEPESLTLTVSFPAPEPGCEWGAPGNLEPEQAVVTARREEVQSLELPDDAIICDVQFDFGGVGGGTGTPMDYDDHFLFTFNDVVLAANYGPMVEQLAVDDGLFYTYDWGALRGFPFEFDDTIPTYCIGEDDGLADCTIPPPESGGTMSLSFEPDIVNELSFRAVAQQRSEFSFVTLGDNDDSDCYHDDFEFTVEVPFVRR